MKKKCAKAIAFDKQLLRKLFIMSKICFILLTCAVLSIHAENSYAQLVRLNLDLRNVPLYEVINAIKSQTEFEFAYDSELETLVLKNVSIRAKDESISNVLASILKETDINYKVIDKIVLLSKGTVISTTGPDKPNSLQQQSVSGTVYDITSGEPLPGVNIVVEGSTIGTVSDNYGKYTLNLPSKDAVLIFSFVGYNTERFQLAGQNSLDIKLVPDIRKLDDVIVVGYATQKKANVIGSVATISSRTIESRPVTTLSSALAGLASGVYVHNTSGQPGADGATILVRGTGTLNSTSPLVVVDGIVGSMTGISPNDVESISVLKDAASAAIYGSLASNGVILITTKSGNKGKISVTYSGSTSITEPSNLPEFVSDYQRHMQLVNEGYLNIGQSPVYTDATMALWQNAKDHPNDLTANGIPNYIAYPNTNWSKVVFQNKLLQDHNIALKGGNQTSKYLLSAGYMNNPGIMPNTGAEAYKFRVNLQSDVTKFLTIGTQTFGSTQKTSVTDLNTVFSYLTQTVPGVYPKYNEKYGFPSAAEESSTANNPLASLYALGGNNNVTLFNTTLFANLSIFKGLRMEAKVHYDYSYTENTNYPVPQERWNFAKDIIGNAAASPSQLSTQNSLYKSYNVIIDNVLRYNTTIGQNHDIGILAGYNQQYFNLYNFLAKKTGLLDASLTTLNSATTLTSINGDRYDYALRSFFGRLNYGFKQRYLLEAVLRYDGSSRFSKDTRWGFFPAFSSGWQIYKEPFMHQINKFVDNLKLRASWGQTGNNASGNYDYQASYNTTQYSFNGTAVSGLIQKKSANPNLKWETTTTTDLGLSGTMLKGAINFEFDVYKGYTEGILFVPTVPITVGTATAATQNIAQVTKKGMEITLGYNGVINNFKFNISGNVAYNINKVKKYKGTLQEGYITDINGNQVYTSNLGSVSTGTTQRVVEGLPINEYYLYPVYNGDGTYTNTDGTVNKNGGPKDGMIRTQQDMNWLQMMVDAGYIFQPSGGIGQSKIWYGDLIYADTNNDGIFGNSYDQTFTGKNSSPSWNYGSNLNLSFKGFDLSMIWAGSAGMSYYWNAIYLNQSVVALGKAVPTLVANNHYFYNEANPSDPANNINARYPRLKTTDPQNTRASNFYLYNAAYLKLKSLQFGYTIPERLTKKVAVSNARIYIGGENLLTITNYPGIDPEIGANLAYPTMRQYTLGLNITF